MKSLSLLRICFVILCLLSVILNSGCTYLLVERYYSPIADTGKRNREGYHPHSIIALGPADRININTNEIQFKIYVKDYKFNIITGGPLYFSIIPLPWFWILTSHINEGPKIERDGHEIMRFSFR